MTPNQLQRGEELREKIDKLEIKLGRLTLVAERGEFAHGLSERSVAQITSIASADISEQIAQLREEFNAL